jgi:hypothetical protein
MAKKYTPNDISERGAKDFGMQWLMANETAANLASRVGIPFNKQTQAPIQCGIYAALGWMRHVRQEKQNHEFTAGDGI